MRCDRGRGSPSGHMFLFLVNDTDLGGLPCVLQPPPAQSMVQALELLYALGGMPISCVFSYRIIGSWIHKRILRVFRNGIGPPDMYNLFTLLK